MFNLFDLVATLRLDSTQYENAVNNADVKANDVLGKGFSKLKLAGIAVFTALSAGAIKFGKDALSAGMDFDKAISQVSATMGMSMEELAKTTGTVDLAWGTFSGNLRDYAKEMGAHTAFTATEAAEALNYMALAGYDVQTSMSMLPNVLNLASAGSIDLARASDMVTDTQTAFGISLERTNQMVDEMAKAASTGNTSVEQLGDAFLVVGGLAKELNGGFVTLADGTEASVDGVQELEIALTAMANAGVKGSEAGTHMRNMLLKLSSPTKEGVQQLEALGVTVFDADGKMRSLSEIMGGLSDAMGNLTQEEKIQAISDLFNARDIASAEALLNAVNQDWDAIGESILNADGAAQKMAETQLDNLAGDITLFKSALEGVQIAFSDRVNPALRQFVQFGTEVMDKLNSLFKMESFNDFLNAFEQSAIPWLEEIGNKALEKIGELAESLPSVLADLLSRFTGYLSEHSGDIMQKGWDLLVSLIKGIIKALPALNEAAGNIMNVLVGAIKGLLGAIWNTGVELARNLALGIISRGAELGAKVRAFAMEIPKKIREVISGMASIGADIVRGLWNGISGNLQWIKNLISGWIGNVKSFIKSLFGISSPSKWARDVIGDNIVKGLAIGLDNGQDVIQKSFDNLLPEYESPAYDINGTGASGANYGSFNFEFNIYGDQKNSREIAEEVKEIFIREVKSKRMAWA